MTSPSLRDPKLAKLYQRTAGAVAFVDESYRAHPLGPERAFYSMSAVTLAKDQLDHVREVLTDIAGGRYWHTTEANTAGSAAAPRRRSFTGTETTRPRRAGVGVELIIGAAAAPAATHRPRDDFTRGRRAR